MKALIAEGRERLESLAFAPSPREARLLLGHVLGRTEAETLSRSEEQPTAAEIRLYRSYLDRRSTGEPVAYILGEKEFYGRGFQVDDRVLIPRPETEHLIEEVLQLDLPSSPLVLDIGTGSGCIAITLAKEITGARIVGSDISLGALAAASQNVARHQVGSQVSLVGGDLVSAIDLAKIDLVVSNPPYVGRDTRSDLSIEIVDFEPLEALFAGPKGDVTIRRLLEDLADLRPGSWVVLEIGYDQEELVVALSPSTLFNNPLVLPDYAGNPRIALLQRI